MTKRDKIIKRIFDFSISLFGLLIVFWLIFFLVILASLDTRQWGIFSQWRIGKDAKPFKIFKIRSMRNIKGVTTTVTSKGDPRISKFGVLIRKLKLDELPQLWNVLIGKMSFVGPRPDVAGYLDKVKGEDTIIRSLKPGITGPASIHFRNEEELLSQQSDPERYNDEVIWPEKVRINRHYIENYSFWEDIRCILKTIIG